MTSRATKPAPSEPPKSPQTPLKNKLTQTRKRIARALVNPKAKTVVDVARIAGVTRQSVHAALHSVSLVRYTEQLGTTQRDRVLDIFNRAAKKSGDALEQREDLEGSLAALKVSSDVLERLPAQSEQGISPHHKQLGLRKLLMSFRAGALHPDLIGWCDQVLRDIGHGVTESRSLPGNAPVIQDDDDGLPHENLGSVESSSESSRDSLVSGDSEIAGDVVALIVNGEV